MRILRSFALLLLLGFASCQNSAQGGLVVTSPEIADVLVSLGAQDLVVGATSECNLPDVKIVGTFGNVNFDKLVRLRPTAVLATGLEQEFLVSKLHKLNIPVYRFYAKSVEQMLENVLSVGEICGKQKKAQVLVKSFQDSLRELQRQPASGLRVYVEISSKPLMSAAASSFVGDLIQIAGGQNIFAGLERDYARIRPEELVKADPQVILCCVPSVSKADIANRLGWQDIAAVRKGRIYTTQDVQVDDLLRATPSCLQGIKRLKHLLESAEQ